MNCTFSENVLSDFWTLMVERYHEFKPIFLRKEYNKFSKLWTISFLRSTIAIICLSTHEMQMYRMPQTLNAGRGVDWAFIFEVSMLLFGNPMIYLVFAI